MEHEERCVACQLQGTRRATRDHSRIIEQSIEAAVPVRGTHFNDSSARHVSISLEFTASPNNHSLEDELRGGARRVVHEQTTNSYRSSVCWEMSVEGLHRSGVWGGIMTCAVSRSENSGFGDVHIETRGDDLYQRRCRECSVGADGSAEARTHQMFEGRGSASMRRVIQAIRRRYFC